MTTTWDFLFFLLAAIGFAVVMLGFGPRASTPAPWTWGRFDVLAFGLLMFDLPFLIAAWPGH